MFFVAHWHGVGTPHFFTSTLVKGNQSATNAILAATEAGDDQVFSNGGGGCDDGTCGVVNHFGCPQLFTSFGVQGSNLCVKAANEDFAIVVCHAAAVHITASVLVNRFGHLGRIFPLNFTRFCIHGKNVFGSERRCHIQSVTNQNGGRFL